MINGVVLKDELMEKLTGFVVEGAVKAYSSELCGLCLLYTSIPLCTICRRSMRQIRTEQNELRFEEHSFCV